jgi:uncharacterized protein with GYD domain
MAFYLLQVAYTPDGWRTLIEHPQNRIDAIKPAIEQLDGTVVDGWLSFGEYDIVAILDLPTNVSAAAMSMAFSAGGVLKSIKTTPLITMGEAVEAMELAAESVYQPANA